MNTTLPLPIELDRTAPSPAPAPADQCRALMLGEALAAVSSNRLDDAAAALSRFPEIASRDAACLNLTGVICQLRGQWVRARKLFGRSLRCDRNFAPADQNLRRIYELNTFGSTNFPIALCDAPTAKQIDTATILPREDANVSLWLRSDATISAAMRDWTGYIWAIFAAAIATAIGWPLVHSLHFAATNVLMLYLLAVLWIATRHSRGAAILASVLGVAVFDLVFVQPYYTFAVADRQYLVTFAVMLLTALVISNLTHRVRQQSELARQAWERVESEFLRNTLLSAVSHELRTPLSAIAGAADTLNDRSVELDDSARRQLLEIISSESARMERLISNLLDMTRLEAGKLRLNLEWLPLEEIVGSTLRHLERRISGRDVHIDLPRDLPMLHVDGVMFEQVLANLIDNIVEYTPALSPIEISARAGRDAIEIEIADRGPGIAPGTQEKIFEKFFRGAPGHGRHGSGLGLAIVRGIVIAHGGTVVAVNRLGGGETGSGAIFRIKLPITAAAPALDSSR